MATITPEALKTKLSENPQLHLVDVRTPVEYRAVHVEGARLLPLDELDAAKVREGRIGSAAGPTYLLCKSGQRSRKAAGQLAEQDPSIETVVVEGGTDACASAGLPCIRGKQVMSLERQVRVVAGSLVAVGVALGYWVHPVFLGLSAFVGCGLVFAGLTDTCGMGLMLARMPWNR